MPGIAVGYDNAAGLAEWDAITPSGSEAILEPQLKSGYTPGETVIDCDGLPSESGFPSLVLTFSFMLYAQIAHLRTTYCAGGWAGKVTLRTKLTNDATSEANYNAIMQLPKPPQSNEQVYRADEYKITFTRLEAL